MLANLATVHESLNRGAKVEHVRFGFIHAEPMGVWAIDQKGGGQGLKQCRLYVFPHQESLELVLITLGDKASQHDDIKFCKMLVTSLVSKK